MTTNISKSSHIDHYVNQKIDELKYQDDMQNLPGIFGVISPITGAKECNKLFKATSIKEYDKATYSALRTLQMPSSFLNGAMSLIFDLELITKWIKGLTFSKSFLLLANIIAVITGPIICSIEEIISINNLRKILGLSFDPIFSNQKMLHLNEKSIEVQKNIIDKLLLEYETKKSKEGSFQDIINALKEYQKSLNSQENIDYLNNSFKEFKTKILNSQLRSFKDRRIEPTTDEISTITKAFPKLNKEEVTKNAKDEKLINLASRIRPWAALKCESKIDGLIKGLDVKNPDLDKSIAKAEKLIEMMKTQYRKGLINEIIGQIAILITLVSVVLSFILLFNPVLLPGFLVWLPCIFFWLGSVVSYSNYFGAIGFLDTKGYDYNCQTTRHGLYLLIPKILRNVIERNSLETTKSLPS